MRNLLSIQGEPNSYFSVLKNIEEKLNNILPITEEGKELIRVLTNTFYEEIEKNGAPLLAIGGVEAKEKYAEFVTRDLIVFEFGNFVSKQIKSGNNNLLINLCAEEHYLNTGIVPEWIEAELNAGDSQITNWLQTDTFDTLNSDLYSNIKSDMIASGQREIEQNLATYSEVLRKLKDRIGNDFELLDDTTKFQLKPYFNRIFESATPMLSVSEFKTNAQAISADNNTLQELIKFIDKNTKNSAPSLNLILGIAKEEHIENNLKHNLPAIDKVVEKIEEYKDSSDSEIEQAIRNGIFKNTNSKLLNNVKVDIDGLIPDDMNKSKNTITKVPEQAPIDKLLESLQDVAVFNPLGTVFEDFETNQKIAYINGDMFAMESFKDRINFTPVANNNFPDNLIKFNDALHNLKYNPFDNSLEPSSDLWDFRVYISLDGIYIETKYNPMNTRQEIPVEDLSQLFAETIEILMEKDITPEQLEELKLDANRFLIIASNKDKLIQFGDLMQIQNLNTDKYVIVPTDVVMNESEDVVKKIVASSEGKEESYPTYQELVWNINKRVGIETEKSIGEIFKAQLFKESSNKIMIEQKITTLKTQQSELNKQIQTKQELLKIAESDSPASIKINKELETLNKQLEDNINEIESLLVAKNSDGKES